jgi:hypothetical protein
MTTARGTLFKLLFKSSVEEKIVDVKRRIWTKRRIQSGSNSRRATDQQLAEASLGRCQTSGRRKRLPDRSAP